MEEMTANPGQEMQNEMAGYVNLKKVPLWHKTLLTLEEAAKYTGIGINKLRILSESEDCNFVVWNGSRRMLKRRLLDEYLETAYSL